MFSDHRPRQERQKIGRSTPANDGRWSTYRICFGLAILVGCWMVGNPTLPIEYDPSSMIVFWTENTTMTIGEPKTTTTTNIGSSYASDTTVSVDKISPAAPTSNQSDEIQATIERLRPKGHTVYSYVRGDRSGAAIQDTLMAHAFAFSKGQRFGGACQQRKFPDHVIQPRKNLLRILGLESEIPFNCSSTGKLMNRYKYTKRDTGIFTPEYLEYMHAVMMRQSASTTNLGDPSPRPKQITVHIRRGDITPCRPNTNGYPRYLPNQHYLTLIERYKAKLMAQDPTNPQPVRVVVFSESETYEPLEEFSEKGYDLQLDGSIEQVWKAIAFDSDVVILSRSSFSLVPAVLASNDTTTIVYTPFWHKPLAHWDDLGQLDPGFLNQTLAEFRRVKQRCPKNKRLQRRQEKQRKRKIKYS